MMTTAYHIPVMLRECIEGLDIKPDGIYVDVTFGGGGHSRAILEKLTTGRLFGFDQDEDALANAPDHKQFTFVQANFRDLKRYLRFYGVKEVDGILADLGISSHQIDEASRGFSTRFDAALDMRMDRQAGKSAQEVIASYSESELHKILGIYGEVKNAKTLAAAICSARVNKPIETIADFKAVLQKFAPRGKEKQVFRSGLPSDTYRSQ